MGKTHFNNSKHIAQQRRQIANHYNKSQDTIKKGISLSKAQKIQATTQVNALNKAHARKRVAFLTIIDKQIATLKNLRAYAQDTRPKSENLAIETLQTINTIKSTDEIGAIIQNLEARLDEDKQLSNKDNLSTQCIDMLDTFIEATLEQLKDRYTEIKDEEEKNGAYCIGPKKSKVDLTKEKIERSLNALTLVNSYLKDALDSSHEKLSILEKRFGVIDEFENKKKALLGKQTQQLNENNQNEKPLNVKLLEVELLLISIINKLLSGEDVNTPLNALNISVQDLILGYSKINEKLPKNLSDFVQKLSSLCKQANPLNKGQITELAMKYILPLPEPFDEGSEENIGQDLTTTNKNQEPTIDIVADATNEAEVGTANNIALGQNAGLAVDNDSVYVDMQASLEGLHENDPFLQSQVTSLKEKVGKTFSDLYRNVTSLSSTQTTLGLTLLISLTLLWLYSRSGADPKSANSYGDEEIRDADPIHPNGRVQKLPQAVLKLGASQLARQTLDNHNVIPHHTGKVGGRHLLNTKCQSHGTYNIDNFAKDPRFQTNTGNVWTLRDSNICINFATQRGYSDDCTTIANKDFQPTETAAERCNDLLRKMAVNGTVLNQGYTFDLISEKSFNASLVVGPQFRFNNTFHVFNDAQGLQFNITGSAHQFGNRKVFKQQTGESLAEAVFSKFLRLVRFVTGDNSAYQTSEINNLPQGRYHVIDRATSFRALTETGQRQTSTLSFYIESHLRANPIITPLMNPSTGNKVVVNPLLTSNVASTINFSTLRSDQKRDLEVRDPGGKLYKFNNFRGNSFDFNPAALAGANKTTIEGSWQVTVKDSIPEITGSEVQTSITAPVQFTPKTNDVVLSPVINGKERFFFIANQDTSQKCKLKVGSNFGSNQIDRANGPTENQVSMTGLPPKSVIRIQDKQGQPIKDNTGKNIPSFVVPDSGVISFKTGSNPDFYIVVEINQASPFIEKQITILRTPQSGLIEGTQSANTVTLYHSQTRPQLIMANIKNRVVGQTMEAEARLIDLVPPQDRSQTLLEIVATDANGNELLNTKFTGNEPINEANLKIPLTSETLGGKNVTITAFYKSPNEGIDRAKAEAKILINPKAKAPSISSNGINPYLVGGSVAAGFTVLGVAIAVYNKCYKDRDEKAKEAEKPTGRLSKVMADLESAGLRKGMGINQQNRYICPTLSLLYHTFRPLLNSDLYEYIALQSERYKILKNMLNEDNMHLVGTIFQEHFKPIHSDLADSIVEDNRESLTLDSAKRFLDNKINEMEDALFNKTRGYASKIKRLTDKFSSLIQTKEVRDLLIDKRIFYVPKEDVVNEGTLEENPWGNYLEKDMSVQSISWNQIPPSVFVVYPILVDSKNTPLFLDKSDNKIKKMETNLSGTKVENTQYSYILNETGYDNSKTYNDSFLLGTTSKLVRISEQDGSTNTINDTDIIQEKRVKQKDLDKLNGILFEFLNDLAKFLEDQPKTDKIHHDFPKINIQVPTRTDNIYE